MNDFSIENRIIGPGRSPLIIAEMSGNHNQSLERALEIVDAAASSGAHALKIQTYTADTMTLNLNEGEFTVSDHNSLWQGLSLYSLYEKAHTPWEWHAPIMARARELGMIAFSTPFDETAVDFLETLDVPCYKIASFENTDVMLIRKVAATGKPIIMSTGMATITELNESVQAAREAGCENLILLKCTSTYPSAPEESNILTIPNMRELFGTQVGLSDHTMGIGVAVASVALGATVIEKHFTLNRSDGGVDSAFSLEPQEMAALVRESECAAKALGNIHYGVSSAKEERSRIFRRSLYITRDLREGDVLDTTSVRAIRPGMGLPPKFLQKVLGRQVRVAVRRGTPLTLDLLV
jgi:pseudaminic acid synthase